MYITRLFMLGQILQQQIGTILMLKILLPSCLTHSTLHQSSWLSPTNSHPQWGLCHLIHSLAFYSTALQSSRWCNCLSVWTMCPVAQPPISFIHSSLQLSMLEPGLGTCHHPDVILPWTLNPTFSSSLLAQFWPTFHFSHPFTISTPAFRLKAFPVFSQFYSLRSLPLIPTPFPYTLCLYTSIHSAWTSDQITSEDPVSLVLSRCCSPVFSQLLFWKSLNPHSLNVSLSFTHVL